ncbi:hypothetical protein GCM10009530_40300 [Microbispora corallina]|uniref:Knr4/Smi1-like domain-containing protein n=1 Tax=Microbispora corallina TaxID=83302 RepID=A0ABQ4GBE2_9ACTN|nr:SMI1/KNR4 family protein [Microbispora corallina]GIH44357.1 hypothetical protein Mco01_73570 [Microbispora corallina]
MGDERQSVRQVGWPDSWSSLSSAERVRAVAAAVADGTTAVAGQILGLTTEQIREVERDQPAPLPEAYRCFLLLLGGGAGHFMQGTDVYHPRILGLWSAAKELLEENASPFRLQETDRVISMHQGYQFDFLRGSGDDPEVWSYYEGGSPGNVPTATHERLTDWLRGIAAREISSWHRLTAFYREEQAKHAKDRCLYYYRINPDGTRTEEF